MALLGTAAWLILSRGTLSYPDYIGFAGLCGFFNAAVNRTVELVREGLEAAPARRRLREFDSLANVFGTERGKTADSSAPASLQFCGISFAAPDGTEILHGVDLELGPGEHVALVGPSGAGKSTLLKASMRHIEPSSGSVFFAGVPLSDWNHPALARRIAYVSQKPFLFDGTIRDNILMGRDCSRGDEDVLALAEDVGLLDDLRLKAETPAKALDFQVGPEGRALSGGQSAKIALARALAGNPDVLLLDEVTASLDELSQERIAHLLATKCRGKTILSVSHRLPTVRGMDRIVVMDGGRIVQDGTWNELASSPGLFAELVARETGVTHQPPSLAEGRPSPSAELSGPSVIRALSLSPVLADLDSAQLARLAANAGSAKVPAGGFLFRRGDAGDALFVVASGRIEINGCQYGPGYAFGEIALFGGLRRTADVLAVEDASFIILRRDDVLAVCRETPDIAIRLLSSLARIAAKA
jgi:ABC-type multidrug transport system ATPase subunit